jgi:hypothetical protein
MQKIFAQYKDNKGNDCINYEIFNYHIFDGIREILNYIPYEKINKIRLEYTNTNKILIYSTENDLLQILTTNKINATIVLEYKKRNLFVDYLNNNVKNKEIIFQLEETFFEKYINGIVATYDITNFIPNKKYGNNLIMDSIDLYIDKEEKKVVLLTTTIANKQDILIGKLSTEKENIIKIPIPYYIMPFLVYILFEIRDMIQCNYIRCLSGYNILDISNNYRIIIPEKKDLQKNILQEQEKLHNTELWEELEIEIMDLVLLQLEYIQPYIKINKNNKEVLYTNLITKNINELHIITYTETENDEIIKFYNNSTYLIIMNPKGENINMVFDTRQLYCFIRFAYYTNEGNMNSANLRIYRNKKNKNEYYLRLKYQYQDMWVTLLDINTPMLERI